MTSPTSCNPEDTSMLWMPGTQVEPAEPSQAEKSFRFHARALNFF